MTCVKPVKLLGDTSLFGLVTCDCPATASCVVSASPAAARLVTSARSPCSSSLTALLEDRWCRVRTGPPAVNLRQANDNVTSRTLTATSTVPTHSPAHTNANYKNATYASEAKRNKPRHAPHCRMLGNVQPGLILTKLFLDKTSDFSSCWCKAQHHRAYVQSVH